MIQPTAGSATKTISCCHHTHDSGLVASMCMGEEGSDTDASPSPLGGGSGIAGPPTALKESPGAATVAVAGAGAAVVPGRSVAANAGKGGVNPW